MDGTTGSLAGIRVIDLSRVLGGPYCTQILGDHGADVIKVEPPQGDETRAWGPPFENGSSSYFQGVNRNKRGIVLDLKREEARAMLLVMLESADVLVENFKPGTLEGWGLGPDILAARFPRLVHCRVSGFGADGPLGGLPGYDAAVQAMVGLMSINGPASGEPTRMGVPVVDLVTGLNAVVGILLALGERERSGRGQFVDIALYDCGLSILHPHLANFFMSGRTPARSGNAHPNISPYDSFATGDGEIFLAVGNDGQFAKFCALVGQPQLAGDPRFLTNGDRTVNRAALRAELETVLAPYGAAALADRLIRAGVPCGPVLSVPEAVAHPHTRHREMVVEMEGYRGTGAPVKLSRTPASYRRLPPAFGEHTDEVLAEIGAAPADK
ncbi:MAG: CoA transferase [Aquamicrobium sp.]|uniref:CaiB/BaiF CoA transferase family protein n=1 Tax=Aquamicrobium sp. TaxID=1872579 RepID=UPI00349EFFDF|nr:CoA transferase [Aquamicrobium sp.]